MKIGILAPEYSSGHGGMPEYARQLAAALARTDQVTVYCYEGAALPKPQGCEQRPVLSRDLGDSLEVIRHERQDVWFTTNACLFALAPSLPAPFSGYLNGNDVLNPWIVFHRPWLDEVRKRRIVWRAEPVLRHRLVRRDLRRGLRAARAVIANSRNTAKLFAREFPGFREKTVVIPPGVGDEFFTSEPAARPHQSALRLLTVARLEQWTARKNVEGVLAAIAMLPVGTVERYDIVGDGDDRQRLERLAREAGLSRVAVFHGSLPAEAIRERYRDADLFVLCARARRHDVEGFGIVYLEASAAGTPVLCSRAGGATDAVEEGVNGMVIDSSEPPAIAAAIERFARERERFDLARVRAFAEQFRWTAIASRVRAELVRSVG